MLSSRHAMHLDDGSSVSPRGKWAIVAIMTAHALLLGYGASVHTPTFNEIGHVPAALCHWQYRQFELYRVNPPLPRMVATLPLLVVRPETDWSNYHTSPFAREVIPMGIRFAKANGPRTLMYFTLARLACIPFSLIGAWVCYRWALELWGEASGLVAASLWCFCPWILGHGPLVMPDVPAAATGALACYTYCIWLKRPSWQNCLLAGSMLGVSLLCKTTLLVLFVVLPCVSLNFWLRTNSTRLVIVQRAVMCSVMLLVCLWVINSGYAYVGSFERLGTFRFQSEALSGVPLEKNTQGANRFADSVMRHLPVPVPRDYLQGIDRQRTDFEDGCRSYLRGAWKERGWWYYHLYGLAVKTPLGVLFILTLAIAATFFANGYSATGLDELCLVLVSVAILTVVSSQTGFSMHVRYVIPALPFLFIWMSKVARSITLGHQPIAFALVAALSFSTLSSLYCYPHSLSYFHELVGGPRQGHLHLLDSNVAWGQDLAYLRSWLDRHHASQPVRLAAFGWLEPRLAGIESFLPPVAPRFPGELCSFEAEDHVLNITGPEPGLYAIDVNFLHATHWPSADGNGRWTDIPPDSWNYEYFLRFKPIAMAGYSVHIYRISLEDANRVRRELGLPELPRDWQPRLVTALQQQ